MGHSSAFRAGLGILAIALAAAATPGQASVPAAAGWQAPVLVSDKKAARETSLALDPVDPKRMFICDPSGVPAYDEHQSYFYRSQNGGKSWPYTTVETSQTDTREYAFEGGDCDVAFDGGGTMWTADTWVGNLSIGHSKNGETWEGTALSTTAPVVDRPWLVGGPAGTLYVTYQDVQCCTPSAIWFTKTTDNGKTFTPAVSVVTLASQDGPYTWEGNFVVAPGGHDLYLVYSRRINPGAVSINGGAAPSPPDTGMVMSLASSHDGGANWSSKDIARIPRTTSSIYPSIGLDAGGYLHVAWAAPRDADSPVFYTMSTNHGSSWTTPKALNPGHTGYAPWVAGGKKGQAAIAWLGSPDAKVDRDSGWYFYAARIDGSKVKVGATTREPLWEGSQTAPEFEMVRFDKYGKLHLGMSVFQKANTWAVFYQRER